MERKRERESVIGTHPVIIARLIFSSSPVKNSRNCLKMEYPWQQIEEGISMATNLRWNIHGNNLKMEYPWQQIEEGISMATI